MADLRKQMVPVPSLIINDVTVTSLLLINLTISNKYFSLNGILRKITMKFGLC